VKRKFSVIIEELEPIFPGAKIDYASRERRAQLVIDDDQPYSRPDIVIANAARSMAMDMLDIPTSPSEGGR
jgi:hypothetical protein